MKLAWIIALVLMRSRKDGSKDDWSYLKVRSLYSLLWYSRAVATARPAVTLL
jgi:hypothetical protein